MVKTAYGAGSSQLKVEITASHIAMEAQHALDEANRYAAAALFTLALQTTQVSTQKLA